MILRTASALRWQKTQRNQYGLLKKLRTNKKSRVNFKDTALQSNFFKSPYMYRIVLLIIKLLVLLHFVVQGFAIDIQQFGGFAFIEIHFFQCP